MGSTTKTAKGANNLNTKESVNKEIDTDDIRDAIHMDNHLRQYLEQLNDTELLSSSEQLDLIRLYKVTGDTEIRNRVVTSNLRFVVFKCKGYFTNKGWYDPMDIIAVGNEALILAVEKFDCNFSNGFLAYAGPIIEDRVRAYLQNNQNNLTMSKESYRLKYKINQIYQEFEDNNLPKPTYKQIADILAERKIISANSISEELVKIIVEYSQTKSLNDYIAEGSNNIELGDTIVETDVSFETQIENRIFISEMMKCLSERELKIIQLRYNQSLSFADIGKIFNIQRATVKQTEKRALEKMRAYCGG